MRLGEKRFFAFLTTAVFLSVLLLFGCAKTTGTKEEAKKEEPKPSPVILKMANQNPEGSLHGQSYSYFAQQVEKESNGQIKVQVYHSGSLVQDPDVIDAIMNGTVDIAHFQNAYISTTIPETLPFEIPGACSYNMDKFDKFATITTPILQKIFSKYGVVYIGAIPPSTLVFVGNKEVHKPADLKGTIVRTASKWSGEAVKLWGGTPMTIPIADVPTSLERKVIDLVNTSWAATQAFKLYEVSKYLAITDQMEIYAGVIFSQKTWDKLTKEQQEAIKRAFPKLTEFHKQKTIESYQKLLADAKAKGVKAYELTPDENKEFAKVSKTLLEQIKGNVKEGGQELMKAFEELNK